MRTTSNTVGVILVVFGTVWFLQGINVLPGSFMSGQTRWSVYGTIAFVLGIGILLRAKRRKQSPGPTRR